VYGTKSRRPATTSGEVADAGSRVVHVAPSSMEYA
jgi:hypothetical protein